MTPIALDFLDSYADAVDDCPYVIDQGANANNPLNVRPVVYEAGATETLPDNATVGTRPRSFISFPSNVLSYRMNRTTRDAYDPRPRGSWKLKAI